MSDDDLFRCQAEALRVSGSGKALLVRFESGDEMWVPQSLIHDDSEVYRSGDSGEICIPGWWAQRKGLS